MATEMTKVEYEIYYDVDGFEITIASNSREAPLSDEEIADRIVGALDQQRYDRYITEDLFTHLVACVEAGDFEYTRMEAA